MKEKCLVEEIFKIGYGTVKYFTKNTKRIFEEIQEEAKNAKPINVHKHCGRICEIPEKFIKGFIKNLGFITEEDIKKESKTE